MTRILKPDGKILMTVPYAGEAKIFRPFHRVYDRTALRQLLGDLTVEKEEYYMPKDNFWMPVSESEASSIQLSKFTYAVVLLKLTM